MDDAASLLAAAAAGGGRPASGGLAESGSLVADLAASFLQQQQEQQPAQTGGTTIRVACQAPTCGALLQVRYWQGLCAQLLFFDGWETLDWLHSCKPCQRLHAKVVVLQ